jgi:hypothetical protein
MLVLQLFKTTVISIGYSKVRGDLSVLSVFVYKRQLKKYNKKCKKAMKPRELRKLRKVHRSGMNYTSDLYKLQKNDVYRCFSDSIAKAFTDRYFTVRNALFCLFAVLSVSCAYKRFMISAYLNFGESLQKLYI